MLPETELLQYIRPPTRSSSSPAKACEDGHLVGAVEVGLANAAAATEIAPVHPAAGKVQGRPDGPILPRDERRLPGAVEIGPPDVSAKNIAPVNEPGLGMTRRAQVEAISHYAAKSSVDHA